MASMPGASSHPHVAARQLFMQRSRFCLPVAKVLILTGWMLTDHGIAASSGSLGPGFTSDLCTNAGAGLTTLRTQPVAHGFSFTAHRRFWSSLRPFFAAASRAGALVLLEARG